MVVPAKLQPVQCAAIIEFNTEFCRELPEGAASAGKYVAKRGDRFTRMRVMVPDGRYRVLGSEWIHTFNHSQFVDAVRALPPKFGGTGIVIVEPEQDASARVATEDQYETLKAQGTGGTQGGPEGGRA